MERFPRNFNRLYTYLYHIEKKSYLNVSKETEIIHLLSDPVVGIDVKRLDQMTKASSILKDTEFDISATVPRVSALFVLSVISKS